MKRIRIVEKKRRSTFSERLEERARVRADRIEDAQRNRTLSSGLEQAIALTLDQIESVRRVHKKIRRDLLRIECYIDTEIMQREPRIPVYKDERIAERDMLRGRLLNIEQERRRLELIEEEKLRSLHDRLVALMNREGYVGER